MKKFFTPIFLLILQGYPVFSQQVEKIWFDNSDSAYGFYALVKPSSGRIQGALVLLDGYGGNAVDFLSETKIQNVAYVNDILVVCIPVGMRLYADSAIIENINRILSALRETYKLKKEQFAIGGMSIGGTIALRYTERCKEKPSEYAVNPGAVFDIDAPVDLVGLYESSAREIQENSQGWWLGESKMIINRFNQELGDTEKDSARYQAVSPFDNRSRDPGNERFLKDIPYRTYHDVDISWYIQNRHKSLYETNILNSSELVNRLLLLGNDQAEFVSSEIKGRRSNGQYNPHSWNIVDEVDLVQWIKAKLHFYPDHLEKPYVYNAPSNWEHELINFPLDFAPAIPYKGFEDLRFAPGWGDSTSMEKWAYTIVWWLADSTTFDEGKLKQDLEAYFTGLTNRRAIAEKQNMSLFLPAKVEVQKTKALKNDLETYYATAFIYDAQVSKKPGTLYFKIHVKDCSDKGRTVLLFEIAENSFSEPAWLELDRVNNEFKCEK